MSINIFILGLFLSHGIYDKEEKRTFDNVKEQFEGKRTIIEENLESIKREKRWIERREEKRE